MPRALLVLNLLAAAALAPVAAPAQVERAASQAPLGPLAGVGVEQRLDAEVPLALAFRDESGGAVRLGSYLGQRPLLLALVYYRCPMLCPLLQEELLRALRPLALLPGRDFELVLASIDPSEPPALAAGRRRELLAAYRRPGVEAGVHFLTGDEASIRALAEAVGFRYARDPASGQFAHPSSLVVLTPEGRISRYLPALELPPRDLRLALVEAGQGGIGSPVDHLLLYCFRYDPAAGRYSLVVMRALRLLGLGAALALAAGVALLLRRERGAATAAVSLPQPETRS